VNAEQKENVSACSEIILAAAIRWAYRWWLVILIWQRFGSYYGWLSLASICVLGTFMTASFEMWRSERKAEAKRKRIAVQTLFPTNQATKHQ
jgi:hypothetical protein